MAPKLVQLESLINPMSGTSNSDDLITLINTESCEEMEIPESLLNEMTCEGGAIEHEIVGGGELFEIAEEKWLGNKRDKNAPKPLTFKIAFFSGKVVVKDPTTKDKTKIVGDMDKIMAVLVVQAKIKECDEYYLSQGYHLMTDQEYAKLKMDWTQRTDDANANVGSFGGLQMSIKKVGNHFIYGLWLESWGKWINGMKDADHVMAKGGAAHYNIVYVKTNAKGEPVATEKRFLFVSANGLLNLIARHTKSGGRDIGKIDKQ